MGYRIRYETPPGKLRRWAVMGLCAAIGGWIVAGLEPVWLRMAAGEGLYDALARFVGGMIHGTD